MDQPIGTHLSTDRYLTPIELERLSHDARWEIVETAARELGVGVDREYLIRIGQIRDGFPYYIHLMSENIFWSMFDDEKQLTHCRSGHFHNGVEESISTAQVTLRLAYDHATQKYSDDDQEVLWAVADDVMLRRQISDIYDDSYLRIMRKRPGRRELKKTQFYNRMHSLLSTRHGEILIARGAGWYEFRENVVRGYVRLRAEAQGINLGRDHFAAA